MLMLSRKTNEAIVIGDHVRVKVTHIGRGRVPIAEDSARHLRVSREELLENTPTKVAAPSVAAVLDFQDSAAVVA